MSYAFDGVGDSLDGNFTSSYNGEGVTIACFFKYANHPIVTSTLLQYGNNSGDQNDSHSLKTVSTDNRLVHQATNTAGSTDNATVTLNVDNTWTPLVGVCTNDALRDVYMVDISHTGTTTTSRAVADALRYIRVGRQLGGSQVFVGNLAEIAIWNTALNSTQISNYMAGNAASGIAPSNLIGYWPLSASSGTHTNQGIDTGGALTVTGAVFDADHPTIITAGQPTGSRYRGIPGIKHIASRFGRGW